MINPDERLTILANTHVSRGKMAAAAVHAALMHYGIPHGAVIVLGASPGRIEGECSLIVRDAGRTEVKPGTVTAGVRKGEDDAQRHALLDAATERDRLAEAVRAYGRTIDRWGRLIIAATRSEDITTSDGDGDWGVIESRLAEVPALLTERDALAAELAHMTEARDNARAEVERLTVVVDAVRAECAQIARECDAGFADPYEVRPVVDRITAALDGEGDQ